MKGMNKRKTIKTMFGVLLLIAGFLLCLNTLSAYRYSTDWNLGVVLPSLLGLGCFAWSLKLFLLKEPLIKSRRIRTAVIAVFIVCSLFFVTVEALIIADPYTHRSELAGTVDTLIVLGCGIWPDGSPTLSLSLRLDRAIEYYKENPHVNIIVSGGQGPTEPFPEAQAMESYLLDRGIPKEKIIIEDKSTSTRENFEFSRKLISQPAGKPVKIVFTTNDYHVLRSRILASRFGFEAYALPAPTPSVVLFNSYLREFFAFVKSMLVDY